MKTKIIVLLATVAVVLVLAGMLIDVDIANKPLDFCLAPYEWSACKDFAYEGLRFTWGAEESGNFLSIFKLEDWHMLHNGSAYDRQITKSYVIQSSILGDASLGDCVGMGGICYMYYDQTDIFVP